jgi:hypothetical protein
MRKECVLIQATLLQATSSRLGILKQDTTAVVVFNYFEHRGMKTWVSGGGGGGFPCILNVSFTLQPL